MSLKALVQKTGGMTENPNRHRRQWLDAATVDNLASFLPERLRQRARFLRCDEGSLLYSGTDRPDAFYRVIKGGVSVNCDFLGDGTEIQCATAGDWLLDPGVWESEPGNWAVCELPSLLLGLPRSDFLHALASIPAFARYWRQEMMQQLARLREGRMRLLLPTTEQRIVHYLRHESPGGCGEMRLPYPNYMWADHLGVKPETLSRSLRKMEAEERLECLPGKRYRLPRAL
ncbi:MAG: hypothetical protein A2514_06290 [Gammaproteobacteria bacterium RIFOXYD12_FULL_61_37]|nr:MAG: hypothetical protein A2514_06290 [Gammaproteobacteria bacterium RIFOXYD12_FULL_61_37]